MNFVKTLVVLLILFSLTIPALAASITPEYRLGPRDVLSIGVWGFEELQAKELIVREDGKLAFPLAGEVQAAGRTPGELTQEIVKSLRGFVENPKVTVNVVKFRTTRVYVLGEIARPGLYELEKRTRLLDAISVAGGYTKDTAKSKVFIVRDGQQDKPIKADLLALLRKGDMSQNYSLGEGDVVYLTDNGRIDFSRDILPLLAGTYYVNELHKD